MVETVEDVVRFIENKQHSFYTQEGSRRHGSRFEQARAP